MRNRPYRQKIFFKIQFIAVSNESSETKIVYEETKFAYYQKHVH